MGDAALFAGIQWKRILRTSVVGLFLIGYVAVWTKVAHFSQENRRLDRLVAAETECRAELTRQRTDICDVAELERFAATHGMVKAPVNGRAMSVRAFSPAATDDTRVAAVIPAAAEGYAVKAVAQTPAQSGVIAYDFGPRPSQKPLLQAWPEEAAANVNAIRQ